MYERDPRCDISHSKDSGVMSVVGAKIHPSSKALGREVTMGYYVRIEEADWEIKETPEALATIREMPKKFHHLKRGGSSSGEKWFSWMNDTEIETTETVENVFKQLGFETESTDGGFRLIGYDSKTGQEDLFLAVMAPYTVSGSSIEWVGEDNAMWRNHVSEGKMFVDEATISWTRSQPYRYMHLVFDSETMQSRTYNVDITSAQHIEEVSIIEQRQEEKNNAYHEKLRKQREAQEAEAKADA